jgi:L-lactate utilization protein LutC
MSETADNSQFYKGKQPVIDEFANSHRTLMSAVAGRNFLKLPGFAYEASIMLEEVGKNKLSALNYQIVAEAIERELKQTGHTYSMTYKAARIAFELEKQTLLTDLQQEFADLDAMQSLTKEELDRKFVELDLRRIILITTKTTIELEMEELKQELIDVDRLTFDNEALLINEKVTTATAKLAVIPYLESLIESQGKLLTAEEANIPYMEDLIDEKELLIDKKEEVVPYLENKSAKLILLAEAILTAIVIEEQRLDVSLSKTNLGMDKIDNTLNIIEAEKAIEALRALLYSARHDLQITKIDRQISLTDQNTANIENISAERTSMMNVLEGYKVAIASSIRSAREINVNDGISGNENANDTYVDAETSAIAYIADRQAYARERTAEIAATADVTNKLIHLIGS